MSEIVSFVEADPDGGYASRALGEPIFTESDNLDSLRESVREAVQCHFADVSRKPSVIRLPFVHDEVIAT